MGLSFNIGQLIVSLVLYLAGESASSTFSPLIHAALEFLDDKHTSRNYSVMGLLETIDCLVGVPLMAGTWTLGTEIGGFGLVLPFFICKGFYFMAKTAVWFMKFESPGIFDGLDTGDMGQQRNQNPGMRYFT